MLRLEGVAKRRRRPVLSGVDLDVAAGEVVALRGGNGSGKTTLLRIVAGLDRTGTGRILVSGRDAREDAEAARAVVGWCGHAPGLFPELTVRENLVAVARLRRLDLAAVDRAIGALGLGPVEARRAGELSRGLAQRAALARAVMGDPPVLLLDEPHASLDAEARGLLDRVLASRRAPGRATLVATHEPSPAWATRSVELVDGRVREVRA